MTHKRGAAVPINALLREHDVPDDVTPVLTAAFEEAWSRVQAARRPSDISRTRMALAKRIVDRAARGERNVQRLVDDAVRCYLAGM